MTTEEYIALYPFLSNAGSLVWYVVGGDYPIQSNACCIEADGDLEVLCSFNISKSGRIGYSLTKGANDVEEGVLSIDPVGKDWSEIRTCFFAEMLEKWKQYFIN